MQETNLYTEEISRQEAGISDAFLKIKNENGLIDFSWFYEYILRIFPEYTTEITKYQSTPKPNKRPNENEMVDGSSSYNQYLQAFYDTLRYLHSQWYAVILPWVGLSGYTQGLIQDFIHTTLSS